MKNKTIITVPSNQLIYANQKPNKCQVYKK